MGLQQQLHLSAVEPNVVQRSLQRIGATSVGTSLFAMVLGPLDQVSHKLSEGRITIGRSLGALPVVMLTTTGAKTGKMRTNPVSAIPYGDDLALVGSNYGRGTSPGWAHNLRANPLATVSHRDHEVAVVASAAEGDQYEEVFAAAVGVYPGYARYRRTAANTIPVFALAAAV
ncbi:MAG: nitroreductase family deazaflavin-dependent oxidoreductase [Acidimicrobiia bacterium]|nr:nitroreductase family deazaflavin-dependent oxidoreductase [Acidimicrobiia bacterium]